MHDFDELSKDSNLPRPPHDKGKSMPIAMMPQGFRIRIFHWLQPVQFTPMAPILIYLQSLL